MEQNKKQRFGFIEIEKVKIPIYLMDNVKCKIGYIAIQNLKTGDTATVKKDIIEDISFKYPL